MTYRQAGPGEEDFMGRPYIVKALQASSKATADLQWFYQIAGASMSAVPSLNTDGGGGTTREGEPLRVVRIADRMHAERPRYARISVTLARLDEPTSARLESAMRLRRDPPELRSYFGQVLGIAEGLAFKRHPESRRDVRRWLIGKIKGDSGVTEKIRDDADGLLAAALVAYEIASEPRDHSCKASQKPKPKKRTRRIGVLERCRREVLAKKRRVPFIPGGE